MIVYRCALERHIPSTLSGEGASRYGGRWNSRGTPVVYTAESRILAVLELVIRQPIDKICSEFRIIPIEIPEKVFEPKVPGNWKGDSGLSRKLGDSWLADSRHLVIKVPSALLGNSFNFLINPRCPDVAKLKILEAEQILMDDRLLKALRK